MPSCVSARVVIRPVMARRTGGCYPFGGLITILRIALAPIAGIVAVEYFPLGPPIRSWTGARVLDHRLRTCRDVRWLELWAGW